MAVSSFFVLDWYTNKYVTVTAEDISFLKTLVPGDKIVYNLLDQYWVSSLSVGTYMPHNVQTDRKWTFARMLVGEEKTNFEEQQQFALKIFPLFKKKFKAAFPSSTPVTSRFQVFNDQIYFYFYSEERYVFSDFVKDLRQRLDKNIFLFQIWARDMIKLSPATDCITWCNGMQLCCKSPRPLPSVEIENIILQNLEWRDIEKLKWRCGKLKCCLIYELDVYTEESKKYPHKWTHVCGKNTGDFCGFVTSYSIMTGDVTVRTDDGVLLRVPLAQLKIDKKAPVSTDKKDSKANDVKPTK